jgi:hypothetical protein
MTCEISLSFGLLGSNTPLFCRCSFIRSTISYSFGTGTLTSYLKTAPLFEQLSGMFSRMLQNKLLCVSSCATTPLSITLMIQGIAPVSACHVQNLSHVFRSRRRTLMDLEDVSYSCVVEPFHLHSHPKIQTRIVFQRDVILPFGMLFGLVHMLGVRL